MKIRQKSNKFIFLIIENWISDLGFKRCIICNFKIHYNGVCSRAHAISVFVLHVLSFSLLFHLLFLMKFKKFTSPLLYIYIYIYICDEGRHGSFSFGGMTFRVFVNLSDSKCMHSTTTPKLSSILIQDVHS